MEGQILEWLLSGPGSGQQGIGKGQCLCRISWSGWMGAQGLVGFPV